MEAVRKRAVKHGEPSDRGPDKPLTMPEINKGSTFDSSHCPLPCLHSNWELQKNCLQRKKEERPKIKQRDRQKKREENTQQGIGALQKLNAPKRKGENVASQKSTKDRGIERSLQDLYNTCHLYIRRSHNRGELNRVHLQQLSHPHISMETIL